MTDINKTSTITIDHSDITIGIPCISCGKTIDLGHNYSPLVPRMCDECKEAIEFAKEFMSDAVHETAKQFRQD